VLHLKKITFLVWLAICSTNLQATVLEQEKSPLPHPSATPKRHIDIVSPEAVKINEDLQSIGFLCPKIAQVTPQIDSIEEFAIAKKYFALSKQFDDILYGAALGGLESSFLNLSQQTLINLQNYLTVLKSEGCRVFRSLKDQEEFNTHSYDILYRMGRNHLFLLTAKTLRPTSLQDVEDVNHHVKEVENLKTLLLGSVDYYQKLQKMLQQVQEDVPATRAYFYSSQKQPSVKCSQRIENQKEINRRQKLIDRTSGKDEDYKESFDLFAHLTVQKILTENLSISLKKVSREAYIQNSQSILDEVAFFEREVSKFKIKRFGENGLINSKGHDPENLTELYRFFVQHTTLNHYKFYPLDLLQQSIFMCIEANKIEDALKRAETLKTLLFEQGPLPDYFLSLHASIKALNGDPDDWRNLIEDKKKTAEKEKAEKHLQEVDRIKKKLEETQKKQEEKPTEKPRLHPIRKATPEVDFCDGNVSYIPPTKEPKFEIPIPREKVKTRKPAQIPTPSVELENIPVSDDASSPKEVPKEYCLSKNAFKTYNKIRSGNPKFERKDLYNLFDKLGCKIDITQGKGDHSRIFLPLNMMVSNEDGLVAVIPEFIQRDLSFPALTIPNWDEKWDGRVPPYMMKSIIQALNYLGATNETVHK
jgi:hypothetical protein